MKHSILISAFTLIFSFNTYAANDTDAEKKKLIEVLLEQTGQSAITIGKQFSDAFIQQMTMVLKQSQQDIDPKAFDILEEEIKLIIDEEIVQNGAFKELMFPIYSKHFTAAELKKMIELNNTEFGKKMIKVMPMITQEGMMAGQQLGQLIGPKIQARVAARFQKEGIQ
ncbi:DUF2059 domain-containing protein [Thalassomonas viridans]|uniref:DUF2059 domain-containing protein n=1 Tax=Thalassomonas viridans TaxID=137584 RepID=A0AAF0CC41_9GAMM|nr:DUF2059 domain-containing protein [Thalassomonas viridans]WDE07846.1 DUF2059 domain-containing protein [Thalassomonas viridans]